MARKMWYEVCPQRLVLEYIRVKARHEQFRLVQKEGVLEWHGDVRCFPPRTEAIPLQIRVIYDEAFPAAAPIVGVVKPELNPEEIGHNWHRWFNGNICYIKPKHWQISTTTDEIISKVEDWYFNYLAKKSGLITQLPDIGRAEVQIAE